MKKNLFLFAFLMASTFIFAQNAKLPENITLKALDGSSVQSSVIQNDGKPVIVSFWATWCKPCNRELNAIKEVYEEWQEETGVKLVAISIDDARSASRVKPHVDGNGWEYEVYIDQNQDLKRAMNVVKVTTQHLLSGSTEELTEQEFYWDDDEDKDKHKIYLSAILDLYDRRIVSYMIRNSNDNSLVFDTFDLAIATNPGATPLCHSDRGFQYTNRMFHQKLEAVGMTQSMSRVAKCIDNGPMEGFWGILKRERYYGKRFSDKASLVKMIEDYIEYYNTRRLQRNLGILTPAEKHKQYLEAA